MANDNKDDGIAQPAHDTYVYGPVDRRYHWRCLTCDATSDPKGFVRRMDADDDAGRHEDAQRT